MKDYIYMISDDINSTLVKRVHGKTNYTLILEAINICYYNIEVG